MVTITTALSVGTHPDSEKNLLNYRNNDSNGLVEPLLCSEDALNAVSNNDDDNINDHIIPAGIEGSPTTESGRHESNDTHDVGDARRNDGRKGQEEPRAS